MKLDKLRSLCSEINRWNFLKKLLLGYFKKKVIQSYLKNRKNIVSALFDSSSSFIIFSWSTKFKKYIFICKLKLCWKYLSLSVYLEKLS